MTRIRKLVSAAAIAALSGAFVAVPQIASAGRKPLNAADKLALDAARTLFGTNLEVKRSKKRVSIAGGALTQQQWNRYVKDVYLPALQRVSVSRTGTHFRWAKGYKHKRWDLRGRTKRAHILLEPFFKFSLCKEIVSAIGFKPNMTAFEKRKAWCAYQSMLEGLAPVYEFRGKAVTWSGKRTRGDLQIDEQIFKADSAGNYPIVITVAGGRNVISRPGIKIATAMTNQIDADLTPAKYRKANAYWKKMVKGYHKLEARMMAKQKRLARGKIAFSSQPFYDWAANKPAKGTVSCSSVYTLAYAPGGARSQGYAVAFYVDGTQCKSLPMSASERDANDFHYTNTCSSMFRPGKVHRLRVSMHKDIVTGTHKRVEWNKYDHRYEKRTHKTTKLGKKLYEASIKCKR